jgi:hypothetical protein
MCLTAGCLYVAGGVSAGGATTFLAARLLRKRPEPTAPATSIEKQEGNSHAETDDRHREMIHD